jgi:methyl-accepting chemotaxis protein
MLRKGIRIAAIVAVLAASSAAAGAEGTRFRLPDWKWARGDGLERAAPDFDDSAWSAMKLPSGFKSDDLGERFWLRTRYEIPAGAPERMWFLTGTSGVALELYVDGAYAGSRGSLAPDFDLRATHYSAILLPSLAKPGSVVTLALRCSFRGSHPSIPLYSIGDSEAAERDLGAGNFWNVRIYALLAAVCAFICLYALLLFSFNRREKANLYYALTLLFMSFYLCELGAEVWIFKVPAARALARASLVLSMTLLIPFFSTFFGFGQRKAIRFASTGIGLAFMALFLAESGDDSAISLVFNLSLLPILTAIGFSAYIGVKAAKAGSKEAWPVLAAIAIGAVLTGHDAIYVIQGKFPFAWLQGIAFFALNFSIFIALSMRQAKLKAELESYAGELESKKAELAASVSRLGAAGEAASRLSVQLEEAAGAAARAAEDAARKSGRIGEETERQAEGARVADDLVAELVSSIGRVNESLASQNESAERTAAAATELSAGVESVAGSVERTADFTSGLAELTGTGEKAAQALSGAMERVSAASLGIGEVLAAVEDFAERSNLLAMNAAIEAAHSGQAGRGFAIIAGEVKKLAQAQGDRAARIKEIVADISARVAEGARDAEGLKRTLKRIADGASEAAGRLEDVRRGTGEQKRASEEISASMEALAAAIAAIRAEAGRQAEYSERVRAAVAAIAAEAVDARGAAKSMVEDGAGLVETVCGLRELTAKGSALTSALSGLRGESP